MKHSLVKLGSVALACLSLSACQSKSEMDAFIDDLMSQMTLEEKIGQLNQQVAGDIMTGSDQDTQIADLIAQGLIGSVLNVKGVDQVYALQKVASAESRLGIPLLVGMDVIHGYETVFPIPLGLSCTWDLEGIEQSARIAAREASANGVAWTFSPMVDICVDPRWGRQSEGAGEDPWWGSQVAQAMVRGYQGNKHKDLSQNEPYAEDEILACIKHFALYGAPEAGRDYNLADMSHLRMYNQYFPPYKAAVEAGAGSVMSSFNLVDGVPATANEWLLNDVLREQWGFGGFVVTDYASIDEMAVHGMGDKQHNSVRALKAGTDMDMVARGFVETLAQSVKEGLVSVSDIDKACRRVLVAKYQLGLFDDPYRYCNPQRAENSTYLPEYREVARRLTAESLVLLRNARRGSDSKVLPLEKKGTIALIGPMADTNSDICGSWSVASEPQRYSTLRQGLERALEGKARLLYARGSNLVEDQNLQQMVIRGSQQFPWVDSDKARQEAVAVARQADVIVCAMGECAWMNGEGTSRSDITLPKPQRELLKALCALGKPVVLLNFAGRATVLDWESQNVDAILQCWYGSESADAIADVLFGDVCPQGKLTVSMPQSVGQLPLYYNHTNTGRPLADDVTYRSFCSCYQDVTNGPLYPFGYGLSYTTFGYSDIELSATEMSANGELTAKVTVTNTGDREGTEIVQLYIHDLAASVSRPIIELKGMQRLTLKPGESQEVSFAITPELLKFYNSQLQWVLEEGDFEVMIGANCKEVKSQKFAVK